MSEAILEVSRLSLAIDGREIIRDISFTAEAGRVTCLVGESGSGKSLTISAVLGLLPTGAVLSEESRIDFKGKDIFSVYQDPMNSFNPSRRIGRQLFQMARGYRKTDRDEFERGICSVLARLRFSDPEGTLKKYPFELSGGMLQRLMIACAIYVAPELIIADEPTTALDVSIQKEIMREFRAINHEMHKSILVVTHDFGVVAELADKVVVLRKGRLVESGDVFTVFDHPREEYTKALLEASFKEKCV